MPASDEGGYLSSDLIVRKNDPIEGIVVSKFCPIILSIDALRTHCALCGRSLDEYNSCYDNGCCEAEAFCSLFCYEEKCKATHWLVCNRTKRCAFAKQVRRFIAYCKRSSDIFYVAAMAAAQAVVNIGNKGCSHLSSDDELRTAFFHEFQSKGYGLSDHHLGSSNSNSDVEEAFYLLKASILNRDNSSDKDERRNVDLLRRCLSLDVYQEIVFMISARVVQSSIDKPILRKLARLSETGDVSERLLLFNEILAECPISVDSSGGGSSILRAARGSIPPEFLADEEASPQLERGIMRLQSAAMLQKNRHMFLSPLYLLPTFTFSIKTETAAAAVSPLKIVGSSCISNASLKYDVESRSVVLVAEHDLRSPDSVYYMQGCALPSSASGRGARISCTCSLCSIDSYDYSSPKPNREDAGVLRLVASQLMQRNTDDSVATAVRLYKYLGHSSVDPHTVGAAMIESGPAGWRQGLLYWEEALLAGADVAADVRLLIGAELDRIRSYGGVQLLLCKDCLTGAAVFPAYRARSKDIFVSEKPVFSTAECAAFVTEAHRVAGIDGGWKTSRHYSVPTTDIPVCRIDPGMLAEFNDRMKDLILPSMVIQFGSASCDGCYVCVHDAFIVKYDEFKQRYLPEHTDQSTHSLVIPLNADYEGGGTYFPDLGAPLKAPQGHVLSFSGGSITHGGDPVLRGTRYIIAVFIFLDYQCKCNGVVSSGEPEGLPSKRRFAEVVAGDKAPFAFKF